MTIRSEDDRRAGERRAAHRAEWEARIRGLEDRMHTVESGTEHLRVILLPRVSKIDETHEIITAAKGAFIVLSWVAKGAKPVLLIAACASALMVGIKTGVWNWP